eukprot:CAMPEP_0180375818 /NCGR_PEP_ID=MMETSP0989-20121125/22942_1 /TAXON_ID=697907 /ORGANISM="non described non described, Strain CCMP2293" /LENGTH=298 /DNA_ID=CAMNT_0022373707 /DNA_START=64 /DNA_END=962 /DNA_ORIENTATION=-
MGRSMRSAALLAAAACCGVLTGVDGFAAPMGGLALRGGRVGGGGPVWGVWVAGGWMKAESDRQDGATEQDIAEAYTIYNQMQSSMNNGEGYWMDEPFQFLENIQTAFSRNFGKGKGLGDLSFPTMPGSEDKDGPGKTVDLNASPFKFKPLVNTGEEATPEPQTKPVEKEEKFDAPVAAVPEEDDADMAELMGKMASSSEAKKKAEADAAALKAKLMAEDKRCLRVCMAHGAAAGATPSSSASLGLAGFSQVDTPARFRNRVSDSGALQGYLAHPLSDQRAIVAYPLSDQRANNRPWKP